MHFSRSFSCLLLQLVLVSTSVSAQTPTSFDMAKMSGDDPAVTARKSLSKARKGLRKAEKLEAKGKDLLKVEEQLGEALADAEHAVVLDPVLAEAKVTQGQILLRLGRADEALESCVSAVRWAPELVHGQVCQVAAQVALGRMSAAREAREALVANDKAESADIDAARSAADDMLGTRPGDQLDEAHYRTTLRRWIDESL